MVRTYTHLAALEDVRQITDDWLLRYNEIRPHDALGSLPPARFREQLLAAEIPLCNVYLTGELTAPRLSKIMVCW